MPIFLTDDSDARCSTGIAVSGDGNTIHICYSEGDCGSGANRYEGSIAVATSTDGGQSFPVHQVLAGTTLAATCRVARGPGGEVYVSYKEDEEIYFVKSMDNGQSFSSATTVNTEPTNSGEALFPYLAVDNLGRIDMVWVADPDNDGDRNSLRYARSLDMGASFSPDIEVANSGNEDQIRPLGLVHDLSGRLHLQYLSEISSTQSNFYYRWGE